MTISDDLRAASGLTDPTATLATNLVFIDGSVPDLQDLIAGAAPGDQVFLIDPGSDGLDQIAKILAANLLTGLSSMSIVWHGAADQLQLGSTLLTDGNLAAHSDALSKPPIYREASLLWGDPAALGFRAECSAAYPEVTKTGGGQGNRISDLSQEVGEEGVAPTGSFDLASVGDF